MPPKFSNSEIHHATRPMDVVLAVAAPLRWLWARRLWALLTTWRSRAVRRRALVPLDHRLLRDAGLTPDRATRESRKPFWRA